jgi:arginyl-tRNA synthetase
MPGPLAREVAAKVSSACGLDADEVVSCLTQPPDPKMGDYSLPCFRLAKELKKDPKSVAAELAEKMGVDDVLAEVRAAGPYLNVRVADAALAREVLGGISKAALEGRAYAQSSVGGGRTVVIEYSSPNIAKPFGIGHLRSTVIGNSLVKLYQAAGYDVKRLNYPGDWGTQFGLLLTAWRKWGDEEKLAAPEGGVRYLVELYQRANAEAKKDDALAAEARAAFRRLEEGDEESHVTWQRFRDLSLADFQRVYDLFGIEFDSFDGEAATMERIPEAIARIEEQGLLKESDGAQIVELGLGENVPPAMIRKSDGATTYLARDFAEALDRWRRYGFERAIYVVGRDQELHFRQLFRLLELMGCDWADRCVHVPFGMIRFGGSKMRTREGSTVGLEDVLDRAFEEVGRVVESREKGTVLADDAQLRVSREVAAGAVVFADLSRRRIKDFDFDWETAFSLDGDTGPYLQYAHARTRGILAKAGQLAPGSAGARLKAGREPAAEIDYALLSSEPERALLKALGHYPDAVARAREENEPSLLGSYCLEIGRALNHFYNQCKVLGEERPVEDARLLLVWGARMVLAEALGILGIPAPEAM